MRWARHIACMESLDVYKILVKKSVDRDHSKDWSIDGTEMLKLILDRVGGYRMDLFGSG